MSFFSIFKNKLSKTSNILSFNILEILKNKKIDDLTLEELENVLISSDISLDVVNQLIDSIKKIKISNDDGIKNVLEILAQNIESILLPREHVLINEKNDEKKILDIIKESLSKSSNETFSVAENLSIPLREARENFEKEYLISQIKKFGGNISKTAKFVGMERSALHRKLKLLGVKDLN